MRFEKHPSGMYHGASLKAFEILGRKKGYSLVGCDSIGANAFFVRNDCLTEDISALSTEEAFQTQKGRIKQGYSVEDQFNLLKDLPHIIVDGHSKSE